MNASLKELAAAALGRIELKRRLVPLLLVYLGVAGGLVGLALKQRSDAIAFTEKGLVAFAQLTAEQTTGAIQNTEQTLEIAETRVVAATRVGLADAAPIRAELRALLATRPFLRAITFLDDRGRTVYGSEEGEAGLDLSDRAYFIHHRDTLGSVFLLGVPVRARSTGEWIIPVSRPLRHANGQFAGVVVASVSPEFLSHLWTNTRTIEDQATTLWRNDGVVMMRSPFDELSMGTTVRIGEIGARLIGGSREGSLRTVSLIDGQDRLVAYLRIAAYPGFSVSVTQTVARSLAAWRQNAWIMALGWGVAGAALAWLALGLVRESNAREAAQDRYRRIFRANPYPMVVLDHETRRLLAVNDAAVEEYGWSREEILAMPINDFYPPEDLPALEAARLAGMTGDPCIVRGLRNRKKDGTIFDVEMHTRSLELDGRPVILTIMENVTVRRSVEAQLRQAQKMEAVGQLTGGISHDFNNVLMVILANIDELQGDGSPDPLVAARLDKIAEAVERASGLTRQLLAFSRNQILRPQKTDLNLLVTDTGKLLRRALGAQIEIESVLADDLGVANIDRAQLETALVNLCINARDAMPNGGRLLIETRNVSLDDEYVTLNPDAVAGDYAMLAVSDTGCGIPPEALARVFEPFFTTKEAGKGTGLGLSMVYGFIKQSSGHIRIYSEAGMGTTIKLYLPRSGGMAEAAATPRKASLPRGSERIAVVEDEPLVRASIVQQLQSLGYGVTEAADAKAGIVAFEAALLPFDLLLTDVVMPGALNGKALADEVTRRWPRTRIAFMSGFTEGAISRDGRLDKEVLLLNKPFRKAELAQLVRRALDGPGVLDPARPEAIPA